MVGIGKGKGQPAALKLDIPAPDNCAIANLDLVERGDDARLRVRDGTPAVIHSSESFQSFNLLGMGLLIGRDIAEKVLNLLVGLRRG